MKPATFKKNFNKNSRKSWNLNGILRILRSYIWNQKWIFSLTRGGYLKKSLKLVPFIPFAGSNNSIDHFFSSLFITMIDSKVQRNATSYVACTYFIFCSSLSRTASMFVFIKFYCLHLANNIYVGAGNKLIMHTVRIENTTECHQV